MPKKKTALTIEERLQQALVPAEEQPYEVPENWVWVRLGEVTKVVGGGTPSTSKKEYYDQGNISWLSPVDLSNYNGIYISRGNKMITLEGLNNSSAKLLPKDTVCLTSRAPIGYVAIAEKELCTNQGFKSFLPSPTYLAKFLYWYLKGNKELLESKASGTTFLELSASKAATIEFPLPPLSEQQRIVERIEEFFAKLDEAKERLQEVADSFAVRKAAILHKAFTGELTKQWRCENGVSDESWEEKKFDYCIEKMQNGLSKRKGDEGNNIGVLRLANLGEDDLVLDDLRYILLTEKEEKNYLLSKDDVIMIRVNGSKDNVARQIVINTDEKLAFCDHIIRIKYNPNIVARYVMYFSKTNAYRKYVEDNMVSSAGQNTISRKGLASLVIPLPSIEEQHEIVRLIDDLLARERKAQQAAEQALASIDLMKKSILARAFRGELGANKASEESALELLKQVLAEN